MGGLRPLMGPKMGGDGGKVAKSIATSPRPDCAPTVISSWVFLTFEMLTTLTKNGGVQSVGAWRTEFYD